MVVGLTYAIGFGWTVLVVLGTFALGLALAGSQMTRQIARLRSGLATPQGAVTDSAMIALGTLLVVVPGIVSSTLGLLLLLPPTRAALRPAVTAVAARRLLSVPVVVTTAGVRVPGRGDYIDGEVLDVRDEVQDVTDTDVVEVTDIRMPGPNVDTHDVPPSLPRPPAAS